MLTHMHISFGANFHSLMTLESPSCPHLSWNNLESFPTMHKPHNKLSCLIEYVAYEGQNYNFRTMTFHAFKILPLILELREYTWS